MSASRNPPWILQPVIFIAIHFFIFNCRFRHPQIVLTHSR